MNNLEKENYIREYNKNEEKKTKELLSTNDASLIANLIKEVSLCGYDIHGFSELASLVDTRFVEIFKKYIHKFDNEWFTNLLIRYLGHKQYKNATRYCIDMYRDEKPTPKDCNSGLLRWAWGLTLCNIRDKRYINEYMEIIKNKDDYRDFGEIIRLLSIFKEEKAVPYMVSFLDEQDDKYLLNGIVIESLANYKNPNLYVYIEPFLTHKDSYIRARAISAKKKMGYIV